MIGKRSRLKKVPPIRWIRNLWAHEIRGQRKFQQDFSSYVPHKKVLEYKKLSSKKGALPRIARERLIVESTLNRMNERYDANLLDIISSKLYAIDNRAEMRASHKKFEKDPYKEILVNELIEMMSDKYQSFSETYSLMHEEYERKARGLKSN